MRIGAIDKVALSQPDVSKETSVAKPFLRWAGSKRKLLHHIAPLIPEKYNTYYEPFIGGGALFFSQAPEKAVISDISRHLIATYESLRDDVDSVIKYLRPLKPTKRTFYKTRSSRPKGRHQIAAQFIYLNKTCWNGLYRVNMNGVFNVPFGQLKSNTVFHETDLKICSKLLRKPGVRIKNADFEETLRTAMKGDLVYLDPPYVTTHNNNGFLEWNENIFSWDDQVRLSRIATSLASKGVNVIVSNADHIEVKNLYKKFHSRNLSRASTLASNSAFRTRVSESLFFAGPNYG